LSHYAAQSASVIVSGMTSAATHEQSERRIVGLSHPRLRTLIETWERNGVIRSEIAAQVLAPAAERAYGPARRGHG